MTILNNIWRWSAVALLLACMLPPGMAQDDADSSVQAARKSIRAARALDESERQEAYAQALKLLSGVHERWPDAIKERAAAAMEAGKLLQKMERNEEAKAAFRSVLDLSVASSDEAKALLAAAALERRMDEFEAARATLNELLERCPHDEKICAEARLDLAGIARDEGHWATAIRCAESVLTEHPGLWRQNVDACQLWLGVLVKCRQWDLARTELARLDALLTTRFKDQKTWSSVERGMAKMSARKSLTPIPVVDPS